MATVVAHHCAHHRRRARLNDRVADQGRPTERLGSRTAHASHNGVGSGSCEQTALPASGLAGGKLIMARTTQLY